MERLLKQLTYSLLTSIILSGTTTGIAIFGDETTWKIPTLILIAIPCAILCFMSFKIFTFKVTDGIEAHSDLFMWCIFTMLCTGGTLLSVIPISSMSGLVIPILFHLAFYACISVVLGRALLYTRAKGKHILLTGNQTAKVVDQGRSYPLPGLRFIACIPTEEPLSQSELLHVNPKYVSYRCNASVECASWEGEYLKESTGIFQGIEVPADGKLYRRFTVIFQTTVNETAAPICVARAMYNLRHNASYAFNKVILGRVACEALKALNFGADSSFEERVKLWEEEIVRRIYDSCSPSGARESLKFEVELRQRGSS